MKRTLLTIASSLLLLGAQAQLYPLQSPPFALELISDDHSLNGAFLSACHVGAALEQLCILSSPATSLSQAESFYFNTSDTDYGQQTEMPGLLTFNLPYIGSNGSATVSEPLEIYPSIDDTLATVELSPGSIGSSTGYGIFAFDTDSLLHVPWTDASGEPTALYNWYICISTILRYPTLYWVIGGREPSNPTCCPVDVSRLWIGGGGGGDN